MTVFFSFFVGQACSMLIFEYPAFKPVLTSDSCVQIAFASSSYSLPSSGLQCQPQHINLAPQPAPLATSLPLALFNFQLNQTATVTQALSLSMWLFWGHNKRQKVTYSIRSIFQEKILDTS